MYNGLWFGPRRLLKSFKHVGKFCGSHQTRKLSSRLTNSEVNYTSKLLYLQIATQHIRPRHTIISQAEFNPSIPLFRWPNTSFAMPLRGQHEFRLSFSEVYFYLFHIRFHRLRNSRENLPSDTTFTMVQHCKFGTKLGTHSKIRFNIVPYTAPFMQT
jgi:hypothetical protein